MLATTLVNVGKEGGHKGESVNVIDLSVVL